MTAASCVKLPVILVVGVGVAVGLGVGVGVVVGLGVGVGVSVRLGEGVSVAVAVVVSAHKPGKSKENIGHRRRSEERGHSTSFLTPPVFLDAPCES